MKGFILSFPSAVVGNLSLFKKDNDNNGSPTKFLGDDGNNIAMGGRTFNTSILSFPNPAGRQTLRDDDKKCIVSCCRFGELRHYKNSVAPLIKRARTICRLQGRGFTLIELLVVVLIIGILAGVAVPQYTKAVLKARYTELQTTIFAFKNASEVYYMANGDYPHSWEDTDLDLPAGCSLNTGTDRGWMYCKKNQLSFDFFDANNQNLVGFYSVNGILKVGYIQWLDNSPYPAQRECWARTQDEEGASFCKSLGGVVGPTVSHFSCTTNGGCTRYILP
ncbi:type IV pilin protein [Candidatus Avelusimicrobium sp.]|uniref:type IV pilin protein n=1 Tax=Candidatus Avelusimicrobium sp. TaxID=3048833 RepID=UPI003D7EA999